MTFIQRSVVALLMLICSAPALAAQKYAVQLKTEWVKKYADRATIDARMSVRHAHKSANSVKSGGDDGDMHFSGESKDIGLPFVAEIVNAALPAEHAAVVAMQAKEGSSSTLALSGAWRLWFEHPSPMQTQGGKNAFMPDHTNPDHSFELHPVNVIEGDSLNSSFVIIKKYVPYTADVAFTYFDKQKVTIKGSSSGILIKSGKLKYNYVGFDIELTQNPKKVSDGVIALARVLTGDGDEQAADGPRRMIFVAGTAAAAKIKGATAGDRFEVLAVPRINLKSVLALVAKHKTAQFEAQLPYEMIIVGVK